MNYFLSYSSIRKLTVPATVTSIGSSFLSSCYNLQEVIMLGSAPPTISSPFTNLTNINFRIIVPYSADHSVLATYKGTSGWSSFESKIIEAPAPV